MDVDYHEPSPPHEPRHIDMTSGMNGMAEMAGMSGMMEPEVSKTPAKPYTFNFGSLILARWRLQFRKNCFAKYFVKARNLVCPNIVILLTQNHIFQKNFANKTIVLRNKKVNLKVSNNTWNCCRDTGMSRMNMELMSLGVNEDDALVIANTTDTSNAADFIDVENAPWLNLKGEVHVCNYTVLFALLFF